MSVEEDCDESHFFILPSVFFRYLRQELSESLRDGKNVPDLFSALGRSAALHIFKTSQIDDVGTEPLEHVVHMHWAEIGLGIMSVWMGEDGSYVVENQRSTEACAIGITGEPSCHFSRGYLAGLAFAHTGIDFKVVEKGCISQGKDHCTFTLSKE